MDQWPHLHGNSRHTNCKKRVLCLHRSSMCVWVIVSSWPDRPLRRQNYTGSSGTRPCLHGLFFSFVGHLQRGEHAKETIIKGQRSIKLSVTSILSHILPVLRRNVNLLYNSCKLKIPSSVIKYITDLKKKKKKTYPRRSRFEWNSSSAKRKAKWLAYLEKCD